MVWCSRSESAASGLRGGWINGFGGHFFEKALSIDDWPEWIRPCTSYLGIRSGVHLNIANERPQPRLTASISTWSTCHTTTETRRNQGSLQPEPCSAQVLQPPIRRPWSDLHLAPMAHPWQALVLTPDPRQSDLIESRWWLRSVPLSLHDLHGLLWLFKAGIVLLSDRTGLAR